MNETGERVKDWIENKLRKGHEFYGLFAMSEKSEVTLLSASFACHVFELLNIIPELTDEQKNQWADFFIVSQDPQTGLFKDPGFKIEDTKGSHGEDYILWQFAYFSLHALDILGRKPKYDLRFLEYYADLANLEDWFSKRNWSNFWLESNNIMFLMFFLTYQAETTNDDKYRAAIEYIFEILDKEQDPKTGYWGTNKGASLFNGMAGASHIYFFYLYFGKKLKYQEQIINSTLSLQDGEGLFSPPGLKGGGSCEDLDAINILCLVSAVSRRHRWWSVRWALRKSYRIIAQASDANTGAYVYKLDGSADEWSYSGWIKMTAKLNEVDSWSTYFRYLSLAFIRKRYHPKEDKWKFRRLPSWGWFDTDLIKKYSHRYGK